jgi:hypothetical protein
MCQLNVDSGSIMYGITCCEGSLLEGITYLKFSTEKVHLRQGTDVNRNPVLILVAAAADKYGTSIYGISALLIAGAYINSRIMQSREALMEAASQSQIGEC